MYDSNNQFKDKMTRAGKSWTTSSKTVGILTTMMTWWSSHSCAEDRPLQRQSNHPHSVSDLASAHTTSHANY